MTDIDSFLQHYGVIGMKWGVSRTPEEQAVRNKRIKKAVIGAAIGTAAVGVGYLIARKILKMNQTKLAKAASDDFLRTSRIEYDRAMGLIKTKGDTKISDILDLGGSSGLSDSQSAAVKAAYSRWYASNKKFRG